MTGRNTQTPRSRGRARGAKGRKAMVQKIARETLWVKIDGKSRRVTTIEALVLVAIARASKGDTSAYGTVLELQDKLGDQVISGDYLLVPEPLSVEQYIAEEMEANKYRKPPLAPNETAEELETAAAVSKPADPLENLTFGDLLKRK